MNIEQFSHSNIPFKNYLKGFSIWPYVQISSCNVYTLEDITDEKF